MLIDIPRGTNDAHHVPGTWQRILFYTPEPEFRAFWSAMICCPECGEYLNLVNHTIADNGQVSPSVGHPKNTSCPWHTNPRLIGWEKFPVPPTPEITTCVNCGKQSHVLGGWGYIGCYDGIVCEQCFKAAMQRSPS